MGVVGSGLECVGEYWLQDGVFGGLFDAESFAWVGVGEAGYCAYGACGYGFDGGVFCAGV